MVKNNTLYQYQGGGYSGCYWEWNFFFVDKQGKFHDIFSSGSAGITDKVRANIVEDEGDLDFSYCLDDPAQLDDFAKNVNGSLVIGVVNWFAEVLQIDGPYAVCKECGTKLSDLDDIGTTGDGKDTLCYDCHDLGTCELCCNYEGQEHIYSSIDLENPPDFLSEFSDDVLAELFDNTENQYRCEFCLQNTAQEIENNGTKEALFMALLTGEGLFTIVRVG